MNPVVRPTIKSIGYMKISLIFACVIFVAGAAFGVVVGNAPLASATFEREGLTVQYLEIVTLDVEAVVAAYTAGLDVEFSEPIAELGGARTASLAGGGVVGVRAPLRDDEAPVVRPYWLVPEIAVARDAVVDAGGVIAHPPLEIPGHGTFAIYYQGGNDHGLWEL